MLSYILSFGLVAFSCIKAYQRQPISFHLLFSLLYLITFFAGFPLSWLMALSFNTTLPEIAIQTELFTLTGIAYLLYLICYDYFSPQKITTNPNVINSPYSTILTTYFLAFIGLGTLLLFISLNDGFLLFKLEKYSQIFSTQVIGTPLKRFFYFFLVALVLAFLIKPTLTRWWGLLLFGSLFGGVSYLAIGGTRANLALAVLFFVILGIYYRYFKIKWLVILTILSIVGMFFLALARYGLEVHGREAWFTFLYLTRDSFSPWENFATILSYPIEYQGLMPFIREFYVYIPQTLWLDRPDIVWNSANYFTKIVLGNQSGLAISPTLLGSFYIMGGYPLIALGMVTIGGLMAMFDRLFCYGKSRSVLIQTFCFAQLFNMIVLLREGAEAFMSRFVFFSLIFACCWISAYFISHILHKQRSA